ncbi:hypothetical protein [Gloeothece verrucosa]|uniref:Uncharacterized protein n=1 Tax=Gloeothece verrucosa (strain PCC 7822) TaxID=497965 RepID=E0UAH9_GLOV7|nr:hypothetical protein [Gloeothece verrucosa]ADN12720.1 hypothetical protein Cyan7822_0687 [Gloeothece verrucosa PCC 7822]
MLTTPDAIVTIQAAEVTKGGIIRHFTGDVCQVAAQPQSTKSKSEIDATARQLLSDGGKLKSLLNIQLKIKDI